MKYFDSLAVMPIIDDEPEDAPGYSSEGESNESAPVERQTQGHRLLVVEDDYLVGITICDLLAGAGHTVLGPAVTGEEAISLALEERPDLVLMDISLPGRMDGVEAAIELAGEGIQVLFVSAHSDPRTRSRGEAASPCGWIEKPFSNTQLLKAVASALP
jgi:two-component system, response regulator PdtaR